LAAALGGRVEKSEAGWGLGFEQYEMLEPIEGINADTLDLYAMHQDQVVECPVDAKVIIKTEHCPNTGLLYKGHAISFQPHPEFSIEFETDLIKSIMGDSFPLELGEEALKELAGTTVHNAKIMHVLATFIQGRN